MTSMRVAYSFLALHNEFQGDSNNEVHQKILSALVRAWCVRARARDRHAR